jgi:iron complex transport system ATP-binding protein
MSAQPSALASHDLCFRYSPVDPEALQHISLEIPAGSITAILGPNGSGKTTLLHLFLGLLTPTSGQIRLLGQVQSSYARREMSRAVGLVPQHEQVMFDLRVLEYVLLGRAPHLGFLELPRESDLQAAAQAVAAAGLNGLENRPVPELSGGERQLATLARALAQQPRVFLMDEPTSHLDLGNRRRVLRVLRELQIQGSTVVFSSHDPNTAAAVADYVILLRQGHVQAAGPVSETLTSEQLSATYGVQVEVLKLDGQRVIVAY